MEICDLFWFLICPKFLIICSTFGLFRIFILNLRHSGIKLLNCLTPLTGPVQLMLERSTLALSPGCTLALALAIHAGESYPKCSPYEWNPTDINQNCMIGSQINIQESAMQFWPMLYVGPTYTCGGPEHNKRDFLYTPKLLTMLLT